MSHATLLTPRIYLTPTDLLDVRLEMKALCDLDDLAVERLGATLLSTDPKTGLLLASVPGLAELASDFLGRVVEPFVRVEALYPFDWPVVLRDGPRDIDTALARVLVALPGDIGSRRWEWFGTDNGSPPFLWGSVEPTGFQVGGTLTTSQWATWRKAFEQHTLPFPMRSAGW